MSVEVRDHILKTLARAPSKAVEARPCLPPLRETAYSHEALIAQFCAKLQEQTGVVYQAEGPSQVPQQLTLAMGDLGFNTVLASGESLLQTLDLPAWASQAGITLRFQQAFNQRKAFTDASFDDQTVGLTSADFGIAESGTLAIAFDREHARLISVAPFAHIVLLPRERIVATYENVVAAIFKDSNRPSQMTFITGPSMTADIQGTPFKGMHGPQKLMVILC